MPALVSRVAPDADDEPKATRPKAPTPLPLDLVAGEELPSGRRSEVRGWNGGIRHEFQKRVKVAGQFFDALDRLVRDCTVTLDGKKATLEDIRAMHRADWVVQLLRIRRRSFPTQNEVPIKWYCAPPYIGGGCDALRQREHDHVFLLDEMTWTPATKPAPLSLSGSGKVVTFSAPTVASRNAFYAARKGNDEADEFASFVARGVTIDGEAITEDLYNELPADEIDQMVAAMKPQGGADDGAQGVCPNCQKSWQMPVWLVPGFFSPGAVR